MSEQVRRQARAVIAEELDAERDAEGRIHLTETHVRFGAAALGSAAVGLTALQLGAVGYAVAQQGAGAGSIGTEANPLEEIHASTIDRQADEISTDTLSIAGNEFLLDVDATVANEAQNVRVRSDTIEIADGAAWNPAMAERYDGSAWGGAVVERYDGSSWSRLYPDPAIPHSVVDHFEETIYEAEGNSLSDLYFDETGAFTRDQNAPVFEGSYSLKGSGNPAEMYSTSGLPRYPVQGETVRFDHQFDSDNEDVAYLFGVRASGGTPDGYYMAQTRLQTSEIRIFRSDGYRNYTEIGRLDVSGGIPTDAELIGEVEWLSNGDITYRLLDNNETELASLAVNDTTFDSSGGAGIGWRVREGQGTFDHLRVV